MNKNTIIAGYGIIGSYTHQAFSALKLLNCEYKNFKSFQKACESLDKKIVEKLILPLTNNSIGNIDPSLNELQKFDFKKITEIDLPINHALVGCKNFDISDIKNIISYKIALKQCEKEIKKLGCNTIEHPETAGAIIEIIQKGDTILAAIGPKDIAHQYGGNTKTPL